MKKIIVLCLVVVLALSAMAGCASKKTALKGDLGDMLDAINKEVKLELSVSNMEINAEMAEYFTGLTDAEFTAMVEEAVVSEAMIGSIPHSTVMLKCKDSEVALEVQQKIFDNVNPRKWLCVGASKVIVGVSDEYVYLAMSFNDEEEPITDNLYSAFKKLAVNVGKALSKDVPQV